jgi:hypothetical protein
MGLRLSKGVKGLLALVVIGCAPAAIVACSSDDGGGSSSGTTPTSTVPTSTAPPSTSNPTSTTPPPPPPPPVDAGPSQAVATPTFTPAPGTFPAAQDVTIATTTPNATIFYTTDGTNPTSASVVYSGAISVAKNTTIRAFATATGFKDSAVAAGAYVINIPPGTTAPVDINTPTGTYNNPVATGLATTSSPATICYTLDGSAPTCNATTATCTGTSATYNAGSPIPVDAPVGGGNSTIKALACKVGNTNSTVTTAVLSFKAADPGASPLPAEVAQGTIVTVSTVTANNGANAVSIHYTTDGTIPTCLTGSVFGQAGNVQIDQNTTIRALACRGNYIASNLGTFAYTVRLGAPTITPAAVYDNNLTSGNVAATRTSVAPLQAANCWATGATVPACDAAGTGCTTGTLAAPTVTADNTTVSVVGCKASFTPSVVASGVFRLKVGAININPPNDTTSGNFWNAGANQNFTLSTTTTGGDVNIRWSTNGATPTCAGAQPAGVTTTAGSSVPTGSLTAATFPTIQAIGCKTSFQDSDLRTLKFSDPANAVVLDPIPAPTTGDNDIAVILTSTPTTASGTNICYNVGQSPVADPDCSVATGACVGSTLYNPANPFKVSTTGFQVKAIACKSGVAGKSSIVSAIYTLKVGTATATTSAGGAGTNIPSGATLGWGTAFFLHSTSEASKTLQYRYTTDGSTPSCTTGTLYNSGTGVVHTPVNNTPVGYKVIACDPADSFLPANIATLTYSTNLVAPSFAPNGGSSNNTQVTNVSSVSSGGGGYLCYTTDNSDPACVGGGTCTGTQISAGNGNVNIITDPTTVKAVSCRNGFAGSTVAASSAFRLTVSDPAIGPATGSYTTPQNITINNGGTTNANVCWTVDGSAVPTDCAPSATVLCTGSPFAANALAKTFANQAVNVTVNTRACRAGFAPSANLSRTYTFTPYSKTIVIDGNDDWLAENTIATVFDRGSLSWDATNVYLAYRGANNQDSTTRFLNFYVKSPTGPYTQTADPKVGGLAPNTGLLGAALGGVNYDFWVRTDRGSIGVSKWDGANWIDVTGTVGFTCAYGGTLLTSDALAECSIPRADIGIGAAGATFTWMGQYTNAGAAADWFPVAAGLKYWTGALDTSIPSDSARLKP